MRPHRLLLPVVLVLAAGAVQAAPQRSADDEAGNSTPATSESATRDHDATDAATPRRAARGERPQPARPATQARPGAPRWHSFLPGMFR